MVRLAVAGLGGWGKNHARVLFELGALAAVCDVDKTKIRLYGGRYNVEGYDSFENMLEKESLDGVVICTPTSTHHDLAEKALQKGLATLVEKPMTLSSKDGEDLTELAERKNLILTVGFIERFNPAVRRLKGILDSGSMGEPLLMEFHRESKWPSRIRDVGIVADTSIHDIDTARWLFNGEPNIVFCRTGRVLSTHEDFATIVLGFGRQKTAFIASNWVTPKKVRRLAAVCTEAIITVDFITQELTLDNEDKTVIPRYCWEEPLMLELKSFVECVEKAGKPIISARDGVNNTKIAEAALVSSRTGATELVELKE